MWHGQIIYHMVKTFIPHGRDLMGIVTPTPSVMGKVTFLLRSLAVPARSAERAALACLSLLSLSRFRVCWCRRSRTRLLSMLAWLVLFCRRYRVIWSTFPQCRSLVIRGPQHFTNGGKKWEFNGEEILCFGQAPPVLFFWWWWWSLLFFPFSFWGVAELLLVVIEPGITLLRQVGFHNAAGFGRNELRKSVVLSFLVFWACCFCFLVWVFWVFVPSWFETGFIVFSGNWCWRYKFSK